MGRVSQNINGWRVFEKDGPALRSEVTRQGIGPISPYELLPLIRSGKKIGKNIVVHKKPDGKVCLVSGGDVVERAILNEVDSVPLKIQYFGHAQKSGYVYDP